MARGKPDKPQKAQGPITALFYRMGVLVTPEEQARLRTLTFHERLLDTKIAQMLPPIPLVLALGWLYNGLVGLQWAAIVCAVSVGGLYLYQNMNGGRRPPTKGTRKAKPR